MAQEPTTDRTTVHPYNLEVADETARNALRHLCALRDLTRPGSPEAADINEAIDSVGRASYKIGMAHARLSETEAE